MSEVVVETKKISDSPDDIVEKLSRGFQKNYKNPLEDTQKQLKELTFQQNSLILQIHEENLSLAEMQHSPELQEIFKKMNLYHNKLSTIKKDMRHLHEKGVKLKKQALKLQHMKEKEELERLQRIRREAELIEHKPTACQSSET